ncbi:hypothetical protein [Nocardia brasiliensis]|uniref:hypothetical protein n=1 Tax=Nocardia brasiliensis TaxID=37326 RepID=UPI003D8AF7A7
MERLFLWPLVIIQRTEIATPLWVWVRFQGQYHTQWPLLMATAMIILLPLLVVYAIARLTFIHGVAMSGPGGRRNFRSGELCT